MDITYEFVADNLGLERNSLPNQFMILYCILAAGGVFFYLSFAALSYFYWFYYKGARYFPNTIKVSELHKQAQHEIWMAVCSIPLMGFLFVPAQVASYRGYSMIYRNISDYGWPYAIFSIVCFFFFTDCLVYWAHRGLHHPLIYKRIHKGHHTYRYTTPFSSHAFHPLDGFGQGIPYIIATFIFPVHNIIYVCMFTVVNCWTIMIHDQVDFGETHFLNSTGHHTIHHVDFNYNYGQYTTIWDRIGGTYKPAVKTHNIPTNWHELLVPEIEHRARS